MHNFRTKPKNNPAVTALIYLGCTVAFIFLTLFFVGLQVAILTGLVYLTVNILLPVFFTFAAWTVYKCAVAACIIIMFRWLMAAVFSGVSS